MKPRRLHRVARYAVTGVLLVAALAWAFSPRPVPVDVAAVTRGPTRVTVDEDGRTRIRELFASTDRNAAVFDLTPEDSH